MGRYISGSRGFSYKYVYGRQPSNLGELVGWAGTGSGGFGGGLTCRFLLPVGAPEDELLDAVGPMTCVFQRRWSAADVLGGIGVRAPGDLEDLVYATAERWPDVLREVERRLPVPPTVPSGLSLDAGARWSLERSQWDALAARIGKGVDPARPASFALASEALWTSGEDELLPFLALQALTHAVKYDLDHLELVDADPVDTNLWDVVSDLAGPPGASRDERAMHARLLHYRSAHAESAPLWRALLAEDPTDLVPACFLFSEAVWDSDWTRIEAMVAPLLAVERSDADRALLLRWRGEARWSRSGPEAATEDARSADALGDGTLLAALAPPTTKKRTKKT